jgi:periplasmic protein TonB
MKKLLLLASFLFVGSLSVMAQDKKFTVSEFYPGGQDSLVAYINRNKVYPVNARKNRVAGQCIVDFTLSEDGKVTNTRLLKDIGAGCGPEAVKVVESLKFNPPGYPIKATLPVNFKP